MEWDWIREFSPAWDGGKARIVGGAPAGVFSLGTYQPGERIPGEWWRVEEGGNPVGYGWIDVAWGDAEMLLAVDADWRGLGVGTFVLDHLEREAALRGLNYLRNVVRPTHPERERVTGWLVARGFEPSDDGVLCRRVRVDSTPLT